MHETSWWFLSVGAKCFVHSWLGDRKGNLSIKICTWPRPKGFLCNKWRKKNNGELTNPSLPRNGLLKRRWYWILLFVGILFSYLNKCLVQLSLSYPPWVQSKCRQYGKWTLSHWLVSSGEFCITGGHLHHVLLLLLFLNSFFSLYYGACYYV